MAAFNLAIEQHADAIELDVMLSADRQVVVMHDDSVDRTTNGHGRIKSLSLSELKRLDAGSKYNDQFAGESIPSLIEVFDQIGEKTFINVELKNYSSPTDNLPEKVADLVRKFHLESRILLSSFNLLALVRVRKLLPKIKMGLLTIAGFGNIALYSRLFPFGPLFALHPASMDATEKLITAVHRKQSHVYAYTVNQPDEMRRLFSVGVDGIFTNDPLLAQKVLADMNL